MSVDADADMEGLFAGEREDDRAMFGDEDDEVRSVSYITAIIYCKSRNLPNTNVRNYSIYLR